MSGKKRERKTVWRLWVDTGRRVVSFHPAAEQDGLPGEWQMMEFHSRDLFQSCIDNYTEQGYRYQ